MAVSAANHSAHVVILSGVCAPSMKNDSLLVTGGAMMLVLLPFVPTVTALLVTGAAVVLALLISWLTVATLLVLPLVPDTPANLSVAASLLLLIEAGWAVCVLLPFAVLGRSSGSLTTCGHTHTHTHTHMNTHGQAPNPTSCST